jgi:muramoyltetrapeptide carboxypeptidase
MERRKFTSSLIAGLATPLILSAAPIHKKKRRVKRKKPAALKLGDTIGLIAPASAIKEGQLDTATKQLSSYGYKIKVGQYAESTYGNFAGSDSERLDDLNRMLMDEEIKAIWCIRGGYGMTRMLPQLNKRALIDYHKLIIGYSDVTALHQYAACLGLVTIHGQVAGAEFSKPIWSNLNDVLTGNLTGKVIRSAIPDAGYTINRGTATGQLTGGNLSLLAAMAGTGYLDSFANKIVFIEDIEEKPYSVDRMLTQLLQATDIHKAKGIALGQWADCENNADDKKSWSLRQVIEDRLKPLGIPTCFGLPFGHVDENMAMPLLIEVKLNAEDLTIEYLEEAVEVI